MGEERHCKRCFRAESTSKIEKHHIQPKSEGGNNSKKNLRDLCSDCHDFIHTQRGLKAQIKYHEKHLDLLRYRLQVLNELNDIPLIKEHGYRSYWIDLNTHGESDIKFKKRRRRNKKK